MSMIWALLLSDEEDSIKTSFNSIVSNNHTEWGRAHLYNQEKKSPTLVVTLLVDLPSSPARVTKVA